MAIACGATSESAAQLEASESKSDRIHVGYKRDTRLREIFPLSRVREYLRILYYQDSRGIYFVSHLKQSWSMSTSEISL